jgi:hypothetical protein
LVRVRDPRADRRRDRLRHHRAHGTALCALDNRNVAVDAAAACWSNWPKSAACAEAGEPEPEVSRFISAAESPIGEALAAATHEKSDSVTLLQLTPASGGDGVGLPVS